MAEWLREFVEARMAAEASRSPQDRAWVEESGGMLLYGTIGAEAYMRPDGSVRIHHDHGEAREEWGWKDASEPERMQAIVIAAKRLPELRRLIPDRPDVAVDCRECRGTGYFLQSIVCGHCGGLGWLAPAT